MKIRHHSKKGVQTSEYFKDHAEEKLMKLERLPFHVSKVDVTVSKEGSFYTVDLCVRGDKEVRSSASTHNFLESLDRSIDKAMKQITKLKLHTRERRREQKRSKRQTNAHNLEYMEVLVGSEKTNVA